MNVTRDVVRDLLTLCAAGDASADSRALVEEYLRRDPALRAEADALEAESRLPAVPPVAAATAEKLALEKTRQLMKTRTSTLAVAVLFTVLPFSFTLQRHGDHLLAVPRRAGHRCRVVVDGGRDVGLARLGATAPLGRRRVTGDSYHKAHEAHED